MQVWQNGVQQTAGLGLGVARCRWRAPILLHHAVRNDHRGSNADEIGRRDLAHAAPQLPLMVGRDRRADHGATKPDAAFRYPHDHEYLRRCAAGDVACSEQQGGAYGAAELNGLCTVHSHP